MLTLSASMLGSRTTEKFPESRQVFPCLPFAYGSLKDPFPVAAKTVVQNRFSLLSAAAHCSDISSFGAVKRFLTPLLRRHCSQKPPFGRWIQDCIFGGPDQ